MSADLCPGHFTSFLAPYLWPGKSAEDGPKSWDTVLTWKGPEEAPGSLDQLSFG